MAFVIAGVFLAIVYAVVSACWRGLNQVLEAGKGEGQRISLLDGLGRMLLAPIYAAVLVVVGGIGVAFVLGVALLTPVAIIVVPGVVVWVALWINKKRM